MKQALEAIANEFVEFKERYRLKVNSSIENFHSIYFHGLFTSLGISIIEEDNSYVVSLPNGQEIEEETRYDNKEDALTAIKKYIGNLPEWMKENFRLSRGKWIELGDKLEENYREGLDKIENQVKKAEPQWRTWITLYASQFYRMSSGEEDQKATQILEDIKNDTSLPDLPNIKL